MNIAGKARANGKQLGRYLVAQGENENVRVMDIRGANQNVKSAVLNMSLQAEKTRRGKLGLYHAHIAPAYGEDKLTPEQWLKAVDDLENELGFQGQSRVVVMHEKANKEGELKAHIHCVWQREKDGKLIGISHNYKKHDAVRGKLEKELGHKRTRQPNDVKKDLGRIWEQSKSGAEFVKNAKAQGYDIGNGYTTSKGGQRGYTVLTPDGQKLNLVRQLPKEVKEKDLEKALKPIKRTLPDQSQLVGAERLNDRKGKAEYREKEVFTGERKKEAQQQDDRQRQTEKFREMFTNATDIGQDKATTDRERQQGKVQEAGKNAFDIGKDSRISDKKPSLAERIKGNVQENKEDAFKKQLNKAFEKSRDDNDLEHEI